MTSTQRKRVLLAELSDRLALSVFRRLFEINQTHDVLISRTPEVTEQLISSDRFSAIVVQARTPQPETLSKARTLLGDDSDTRIVAVVDTSNLEEAESLFSDGADLVLGGNASVKQLVDTIVQASNTPTVLSGCLTQLGVPDLLQILCLCHRSLMLRIRGERTRGVLWLADGEIHHAVCGGRRGQEAVNDLIQLTMGQYAATVLSGVPRRTIERDWQHVLLEAARVGDETGPRTARRSTMPPATRRTTVPPGGRTVSGVHKSGLARYRELTELGLESVRSGDLSKAREYWKAAREITDTAEEEEGAEPAKVEGGVA